MRKIFGIVLLILILFVQWQGKAFSEEFPLQEWCHKFASLENGGRQLEKQFFLLFDVLDAELPDATVERIVTTTFTIWSDNFKSAGISNSYYDFIRTFKIQVDNYDGEKDFDDLFKAYCIALLAEAHIPR